MSGDRGSKVEIEWHGILAPGIYMLQKRAGSIVIISLLSLICLFFSANSQGESQDPLTLEYQDPAGDIQFFNETNNGTATEMMGLDIKWIRSSVDGEGNVVISIDLKSREHFIIDNSTKYVLRIFTTPDNSTGFNVTYRNGTVELVTFNTTGEGEKIDLSANLTFNNERDDEILEIEVQIYRFLENVSYFNIDAYSMMITDNATYLDYTGQMPGHPEYVDPAVEESEGLDSGDDKTGSDDNPNYGPLIIISVVLFIVFVIGVLIVLIILLKGKKNGYKK